MLLDVEEVLARKRCSAINIPATTTPQQLFSVPAKGECFPLVKQSPQNTARTLAEAGISETSGENADVSAS